MILLHKQKTSAMVRFLVLPDGLLAFAPLPESACLREEDYAPDVEVHPAAPVAEAEQRLGLARGGLEAEGDFHAWVHTPDGDVPVLMGVFTEVDPPVEAVARLDGRFITMMEARRLSSLEQLLLRRAYEHVLG